MEQHFKETLFKQYEAIDLLAMERVKLMNRLDTKFAFGKNTLNHILEKLREDYFVLEIHGKRTLSYESLYFDDASFSLFNDHHRGKSNRTKVRIRHYVDTDNYFFEIKQKHKGRTLKYRTPCMAFQPQLNPEQELFIFETLGHSMPLTAQLTNRYIRITLVHKSAEERLTLDFNIQFTSGNTCFEMDHLVIAELKQDRVQRQSPFFQLMKSMAVRPYPFSKYCMGIMALQQASNVRSNRFKFKKRVLEKINAHDV